jgi:hypothetical protein
MGYTPAQRDSRRRPGFDAVPRRIAAGIALAISTGCSTGPARVNPPPINASRAAAAAVQLCDQDHNGTVSPAEAAASPGLAAAFERIDTNHDGGLSAAEIAARIATWANSGLGLVSQPIQITMNGRSLPGGRVELVPEPYLAQWLKPAGSDVAPNGICNPSLPPADLPQGLRRGMNCGFYTVRITHPELKLPARFNAESTLGIEVRPDSDLFNPPRLTLETRPEEGRGSR